MKRPKMILFDYGQTLVAERCFDGVRGTAAVMEHAVENVRNLTPEEVQAEADKINRELKRFDPVARAQNTVEIPNHMFTGYLYESLGIKLDISSEETDRILWDEASPASLRKGCRRFLNSFGMREFGLRCLAILHMRARWSRSASTGFFRGIILNL